MSRFWSVCHECGKGFATQKGLLGHYERNHTKEKKGGKELRGKKRGVKKGKPGATKEMGGCPYCDKGPFRRLAQHIAMAHKGDVYVSASTAPKDKHVVEEILAVPKPEAGSVQVTLISCAHCPYVTLSELEMDRHLREEHWMDAVEKFQKDWLQSSKKKVLGKMYLLELEAKD